jgi:AcrR family transcriptional regulator
LFCARGFAAVSMRDIGREAGVSHALIHRYLGSKQDVYRAVLKRADERISSEMSEQPDFTAAVPRALRYALTEQRAYMRLVTLSALQQLPYSTTSGQWPATQRLMDLAEKQTRGAGERPDRIPPGFLIATLISLAFGWTALESWLRRGAGLEDLDDEALMDGLAQVAAAIAAQLDETEASSPPPTRPS